MNSNNIKAPITSNNIEFGEENIFLPIEVEKYLNVIHNHIILI